jgi:hypothetical protein
MTGIEEVIKHLENQKEAIEKASTALQDVEGTKAPETDAAPSATPTRKGGMTPEGKSGSSRR